MRSRLHTGHGKEPTARGVAGPLQLRRCTSSLPGRNVRAQCGHASITSDSKIWAAASLSPAGAAGAERPCSRSKRSRHVRWWISRDALPNWRPHRWHSKPGQADIAVAESLNCLLARRCAGGDSALRRSACTVRRRPGPPPLRRLVVEHVHRHHLRRLSPHMSPHGHGRSAERSSGGAHAAAAAA